VAEKKVRLPVRMSENIPSYYAHGLWGGIGPTGEVIAYLLQDSPGIPESFSLRVDEETGLVQGIDAEMAPGMDRSVLAKIVIPAPLARSFADWFSMRARDSEQAQGRPPAGS